MDPEVARASLVRKKDGPDAQTHDRPICLPRTSPQANRVPPACVRTGEVPPSPALAIRSRSYALGEGVVPSRGSRAGGHFVQPQTTVAPGHHRCATGVGLRRNAGPVNSGERSVNPPLPSGRSHRSGTFQWRSTHDRRSPTSAAAAVGGATGLRARAPPRSKAHNSASGTTAGASANGCLRNLAHLSARWAPVDAMPTVSVDSLTISRDRGPISGQPPASCSATGPIKKGHVPLYALPEFGTSAVPLQPRRSRACYVAPSMCRGGIEPSDPGRTL